MRALSSQLGNLSGTVVTVSGILASSRVLGKISFLILKDVDGYIQVVVRNFALSGIFPGSIISAKGTVVESKSNTFQFEVVSDEVTLLVSVSAPPVIDYSKKEMTCDLDFMLEHRSVSLRHCNSVAVFTVQSDIARAFREYMHEHSFTEFFGPCMVPSGTESGADIFKVEYFERQAYLAQSNQLYKQILVGCFERVFGIMPFFRADPSHTTHHLSEGKQLECEMGFVSLEGLLDFFEGLIRHIVSSVEQRCFKHLEALECSLPKLPSSSIPRFTFQRACELIGICDIEDFGSKEEKQLSLIAKEEFNSDFLFITHWPIGSRPFYSFPYGDITLTFDLICRGTEVCSGGMRRHTVSLLNDGIDLFGIDRSDLEFYIEAFEHGLPPHGGFGMGLERLTMKLLDLSNIRNASLFPSDCKRIASSKEKKFFGNEIRAAILSEFKRANIAWATSYENCVYIKSIILVGKSSGNYYQFALPMKDKLDMILVADVVGEDCKLANPDDIYSNFGLLIGAIPPFGRLFGTKSFADNRIMHHEHVNFNIGSMDEHMTTTAEAFIKISAANLVRLVS